MQNNVLQINVEEMYCIQSQGFDYGNELQLLR